MLTVDATGSAGATPAGRGGDLVAARSRAGDQALAHKPVTLGDQRRVPGLAVLLVEVTSSPLAETRAVRRASVRSGRPLTLLRTPLPRSDTAVMAANSFRGPRTIILL